MELLEIIYAVLSILLYLYFGIRLTLTGMRKNDKDTKIIGVMLLAGAFVILGLWMGSMPEISITLPAPGGFGTPTPQAFGG